VKEMTNIIRILEKRTEGRLGNFYLIVSAMVGGIVGALITAAVKG
jgi:hypothetical protein